MSAQQSNQSYEIPDRWDDVDPVLIPLLVQTGEWFQEPGSCYETAFGPFGSIVDLTPEAVTFQASVYDEVAEYHEGLRDEWEQSERVNGRVSVADEATATNQDEPAVWLQLFGRHTQIWERVPFESRATTFEEVKTEIDSLIDDGNPYWDETLEAAREVAVEMGLCKPVDTLSDDQLHTTLQVLEVGRDDVDQLTDDQKSVLNEAHVIVQEMQELSAD